MSDALPSDPAELREMIAALEVENARMTKENARLAATLRAHDLLIEALRARIAKLQRQRFGPSSEKIEREIEQLVLALEDLQVAAAEGDTIEPEDPDADASVSADTEVEAEEPAEAPKPRRRPRVAEGTPRERRVLGPGEACPDCGGDLRIVGQDVSELVDLIAAKLKVIEIARPKASCRRCERMVQAPAPSRPIPRSMAGPGLLAHVLVSKFDDHVPLYRQAEVFARMGADIPDTTLVDWCGRAMKALQPVIERIEACVMACDLLHADDTPIRVLDRGRRSAGLGRGVKQGRIWAYVRDQRPWAGPEPPGVVYRFSPDRKGEHPRRHLAGSAGVLQADAYSGFRELYEPGTDGTRQFREAACWAHLRRAFHDVWTATQSAIARDALDRIGALYDLERQIAGRGAAERLAARAAHSAPKVEAFRAWSEAQLARLPGKGDLAKAFRYALKRWPSFTLFLEDGRVAIDNNAAERAMRPIGVGREPLALRGLGHRRRDPRPRHDPHRDRQDERPRPPGLPRRPPRPHPRPQGQPDRRAAALELDAQPHRGSGRRLNRGPNRVVTALGGTDVMVGAQTMHWADAGAWTGEISAPMLVDCGARMVEIGHSERRAHFGETDEAVGLKARAAVRHGLIPLVCVGETAREKAAGRADAVLRAQVEAALGPLEGAGGDAPIVLAYEPVWAIGEAGTPASPDYAEERHARIAQAAREVTGRRVPCLYGGSVDAGNCAELIARAHVDGLFVGRAAWAVEGYLEILTRCAEVLPKKETP